MGFLNRECTSFVAFRMNTDNQIAFSNNMSGGHWGSAYQWMNNAISLGYAYNGTAALGSVAWWDAYYHGASAFGHVAYVKSVNGDGSIDTEDYNALSTGMYASHHYPAGSSSWPSGFIHVRDLSTSPWGGIGSATFVGSDTRGAGQQISSNQYLLSADARFALILQTDGNLVEYGGRAIWSSGTGGSGANHLVMQTDGNLVLYTASNVPVWQSGTGGTGQAHMVVQSDGNIVTYSDSSGGPTWWTGTGGHASTTTFGFDSLASGQQLNAAQQQYLLSPDKRHGLLLQADGNLVLYGPGYHVLWQSGTNGATRLVMQVDSNLVLYNIDTPLWFTGTGNTGSTHATLQSDGNFVTYTATSAATWWTGTGGQL